MQTSVLTCVGNRGGNSVAVGAAKRRPPLNIVSPDCGLPSSGAVRRILLLEDDLDTQDNLRDLLEIDGYRVDAAAAFKEVAEQADWPEYEAILLDRRLTDGLAEDLLPPVRRLAPQAAVILMTGYPDLDSTIAALRHGAADYILKPVNATALRASLARIAELADAERRARQAERLAAVGQMITVVSHEARNRLQLTQVNLEMLAEEVAGQEEPLRLVNRIFAIQEDLKRLFDDVRSSVAPLIIEPEHSNLAAVVRKAFDEVKTVARGKSMELREQLEEVAEPRCDVDAFRMGQVFRNLFENSLAACPTPVVVRVRYESVERAGRSAVRVTVRDNGPGLNAEQKQRVFEPFYTTKHKGTGLGMAIAKRVLEAHGGDIEVGDGTPGAEFIITLPTLSRSDVFG